MDRRINSIDIFRGISIILVIWGHIYQFWTKRYAGLFGDVLYFIYIASPPYFIMIAGISFYIFINKRIMKEIPKREIFFTVLKRSFFLFVVSTLIQLIFAPLADMEASFIFFILYWNIFQLMALAMISFFVIPFLQKFWRIFLYISLYFLIFLINHIIVYYEIESLYVLIEGGSFPYLPWANFYLFGIAFGDLLINTSEEQLIKYIYLLLPMGIILFINYLLWAYPIYYLSIELWFKALGFFFVLFSILYYYTDIKEADSSLQQIVIKWGRLSFSIYYIHWAIVVAGLIIFPLVINDIYARGFLIYQYIILVIIVCVMLELFMRVWEKFDYKFGLEWFMNKFTKNPMFHFKKEINED